MQVRRSHVLVARPARSRRRAFTLLEVLMVILILGLLAALIVPQFTGTQEKAKVNLTRTQIESLSGALERFKIDCGRYPSAQEGLAALVVKPSSEDVVDKWAGKYIKQPAKDAWNRDLNYVEPGNFNTDSFDLSSSGRDGVAGNEDDITNWQKS